MTPIQLISEWVVRSAILILAGALLVWLLRVKSPSIRQMAWTGMLAASLAIPLLTAVMPKVRFDISRAPGPFAPVLDRAPSHHEAHLLPASPDSISAPALPIAVKPFDWIRFAAILYAGAAGALMLRLIAGLVLSYRILHRSRPAGIFAGRNPVRESDDVASPVTIGVLRPAIVLPMDWQDWDSTKLDAVLAHERSHIRRRDPAVQFLSAAHRALLWANPLSWFLHRNLVRTAEEISDDDAIRATRDRVSYAEILLEFVQRGVGQSITPGIPMASYDRPEKRIRRILNSSGTSRAATGWSVAAILVMGAPLAYLAAAADPQPAPQSTSQAAPKAVLPEKQPKFEVASIKPAPPQPPPDEKGRVIIRVGFGQMPGGGLRVSNMSLRELIARAYKIDCYDQCRDFITGGPDWVSSSRYDIQARGPQPPENLDHLTAAQRKTHTDQLLRQRLQALLADRFQLVLRRESKVGQNYALRIAKSGHKLKPGTEDGKHLLQGGDQTLIGENATMEELAVDLQNTLGRPVTDNTWLAGKFNFKLVWSPLRDESAGKADLAADVSGYSIFGALQSQLGLRLEPVKGPVTKLVVVRAERPSEN